MDEDAQIDVYIPSDVQNNLNSWCSYNIDDFLVVLEDGRESPANLCAVNIVFSKNISEGRVTSIVVLWHDHYTSRDSYIAKAGLA